MKSVDSREAVVEYPLREARFRISEWLDTIAEELGDTASIEDGGFRDRPYGGIERQYFIIDNATDELIMTVGMTVTDYCVEAWQSTPHTYKEVRFTDS
jgi:hypothetical protein